MKDRKTGLFWITFSDILLSLFFVILVLFIFTFFKLKEKNASLEKKVEKLKFLQQVEEDMKALSEGDSFVYKPEVKKYFLKEPVHFALGKSDIPRKDEYNLLLAGKKIKGLVDHLKARAQKNHQKIKYLLIIEGMASKDNYQFSFELSYSRAKSVSDFWHDSNINFDPDVVETLISGSGTAGSVRNIVDESANQAVMIQIVPKNMPEYMDVK